jgi:hypothetical protein
MGFEDCFSVYQDYEIDFGLMHAEARQHTNSKAGGVISIGHEVPTCPGRYLPRNNDFKLSSPLAQPKEVIKYLKNSIWVVSHGGVASERFRSTLGTKEKNTRASGSNRRPLKGVVAHYPYPVPKGPCLCVYIFGSVYDSILSQLRRHPDNIQKLHNDESFPSINTIEDLLAHPDHDPFGIQQQFIQFYHANVSYPIIYMKYEALLQLSSLQKLDGILLEMTGNSYNLTSLFDSTYRRVSSLDTISDIALRTRFIDRYRDVQQMFDSQPLLRVKMPASQ